MAFRIRGLDPAPFLPLYGRSSDTLAQEGIVRMSVDAPQAYPDRIELRDASPGESVLLLNHTYLDAPTPYRGTHAIFVREGATERYDQVDEVPDALRIRLLSVRAFDHGHMMIDAEVVEGTGLRPLIERWFDDERIAFLQLHHARRGCYAAQVDRA